MKGKIRRIIAIALLVCFIASISATAVSAYSLQSSAYKSSARLRAIASGDQSKDLRVYTYDTSYDHAVRLVQTTLYREGYLSYYQIDGAYGPKTSNAVWSYQYNNSPLEKDGVVGPLTLQKLDEDQWWYEHFSYT